MGKAISLMLKPAKKFNIENRAHKVISREKPVPAPSYESTKKQLEIARAAHPSFMEDHYKKDAGLDDRLKNVYVQSHDNPAPQVEPNPDRPLPFLTRSGEDFAYGFWEPQQATEGRCALRTAMAFMSDYMDDPVKNSIEQIAAKHKLNVKDVANILEYYRVFKVVVHEGKNELSYVVRDTIAPGQMNK